ncbi:NAD(P)/FAD-dependent oxidoreductase [Falsirhodobacter sp. 20TX0035]|uniref:NAD(P)/FAD-dependent oxidoreductase n=1 Tax=Falsirhodobacter sp. 20TX0035 TaxID=3022019 RepID=UPI00232E6B46|nr:FAD-binding oxidoreductase [Falsirhodobacter sp. 20TX0035]MDB6454131.1 FAD-binding oxidoreductase [Falsirhodobacter sp. 20TX0035]
MPGPTPDIVQSDPVLPAAVDVVVIGAGIAGLSAALELAERGLRVAVCEKGLVGAEQSSRNWGWVRTTHRDPREMPLMVESVRLWKDLDCRTGGQTGYRQCGVTFMAATPDRLAAEEAWLDLLHDYQIPARIVGPDEVAPGYRGMALNVAGGVFNPEDGRAEPQKANAAIARAIQTLGGTVHQNCAIRTVERQAGRVAAVITEHGRIACSQVLVAGGIWSRLFLGNLGIQLPQLRTRNSVLRTSPVEGGPEGSIRTPDFTLRRRADGGYTIASGQVGRFVFTPDSVRLLRAFLPAIRNEWRGLSPDLGAGFLDGLRTRRRWTADEVTPFERCRIMDPAPDRKAVEATFRKVQDAWPDLRAARIEQAWAGIIDVTPDVIPVISDTESVKNGIPGLFVSTGFSGHGFGLGPGAGRLAADLMTGRAPVVDPTPFRLGRFTDGTRITPIPGLTRR